MNAPATAPEPTPTEPRLPATIAADQRNLAEYRQPPSQMATSWLTPTSLQSALQLAELMSKCRLVPQHLQGSISDCVLVLSQAARWGMDPFAVAQATAVVKGKLCFEGKLVAAALIATGAVEGGLDYEFEGEGQGMSVTVSGIVRRTGKLKTLKGDVQGWRTRGENSPWDKDVQSMLVYRGTRQWCRLFAPETILGVNTPDEMQEAQDVIVTGTEPGDGKPGVVPEPQAPKRRSRLPAAAAEQPSSVPLTGGETAAPPTTPPPIAGRPEPDQRVAILVTLAGLLHDSGPLGAAEARSVANRFNVAKLQNVPVNRLNEALKLVRDGARACNVTLPAPSDAETQAQAQPGGAA